MFRQQGGGLPSLFSRVVPPTHPHTTCPTTRNAIGLPRRCRIFLFASALSLSGSIVLLVVAHTIIQPLAEPNGELALWYSVATCLNSLASFGVAGRATFDVYTMRPVITGELPGNACPVVPAHSEPLEITLEASDGWRHGGKYEPVLLVPLDTYVSVSLEIVDALGRSVFPRETLSLGPTDGHPWAANASLIAAALPLADLRNYTGLLNGSNCADSCRYASDGTCDDGGGGAEYAHCLLWTDCADCGTRPEPSSGELSSTSGASTLASSSAASVASSSTVRRLAQENTRWRWRGGVGAEQQVTPAMPSAEIDAGEAWPPRTRAPSRRQLLKGGGGSYGGRSSLIGPGRWGAQPVTWRTASTAAAFHVVSGRHYGGGGRAFFYEHGSAVYDRHAQILVVSSEGYGCYSCEGANRTCQACANCTRREQCAGERVTDVPFALDRFELGLEVHMPPRGSERWPLRMTVSNATLFSERGHLPTSGADVLISFYTEDGDVHAATFETMAGLGWAWATLTFVVPIFCLPVIAEKPTKKKKRRKQPSPESDHLEIGWNGRHTSVPTVTAHACQRQRAYAEARAAHQAIVEERRQEYRMRREAALAKV